MNPESNQPTIVEYVLLTVLVSIVIALVFVVVAGGA